MVQLEGNSNLVKLSLSIYFAGEYILIYIHMCVCVCVCVCVRQHTNIHKQTHKLTPHTHT